MNGAIEALHKPICLWFIWLREEMVLDFELLSHLFPWRTACFLAAKDIFVISANRSRLPDFRAPPLESIRGIRFRSGRVAFGPTAVLIHHIERPHIPFVGSVVRPNIVAVNATERFFEPEP